MGVVEDGGGRRRGADGESDGQRKLAGPGRHAKPRPWAFFGSSSFGCGIQRKLVLYGMQVGRCGVVLNSSLPFWRAPRASVVASPTVVWFCFGGLARAGLFVDSEHIGWQGTERPRGCGMPVLPGTAELGSHRRRTSRHGPLSRQARPGRPSAKHVNASCGSPEAHYLCRRGSATVPDSEQRYRPQRPDGCFPADIVV